MRWISARRRLSSWLVDNWDRLVVLALVVTFAVHFYWVFQYIVDLTALGLDYVDFNCYRFATLRFIHHDPRGIYCRGFRYLPASFLIFVFFCLTDPLSDLLLWRWFSYVSLVSAIVVLVLAKKTDDMSIIRAFALLSPGIFIVLLLCWSQFMLHLLLGQNNSVTLLCVALFYYYGERSRKDPENSSRSETLTGFFLGLAVALKITPGLFVVLLVVQRRTRALLVSVGLNVGALVWYAFVRVALGQASFFPAIMELFDVQDGLNDQWYRSSNLSPFARLDTKYIHLGHWLPYFLIVFGILLALLVFRRKEKIQNDAIFCSLALCQLFLSEILWPWHLVSSMFVVILLTTSLHSGGTWSSSERAWMTAYYALSFVAIEMYPSAIVVFLLALLVFLFIFTWTKTGASGQRGMSLPMAVCMIFAVHLTLDLLQLAGPAYFVLLIVVAYYFLVWHVFQIAVLLAVITVFLVVERRPLYILSVGAFILLLLGAYSQVLLVACMAFLFFSQK